MYFTIKIYYFETYTYPQPNAHRHYPSIDIPGKLSLCVGMPVMIRNNSATELCITKGQEATVHSWQSDVGSKGQIILDTLFVTLLNPPQSVQLDGLPKNVVPLMKTSVQTTCMLPDDTCININRSQIEVVPNFSMTDFSSQGKTRPYNVVDLNNSRTHQSYYTALSRSASAEGTIILQGFDAKKITGGASGALRQEFRELELLNEITRLRFVGKLPDTVVGERRNTLLHSFRSLKGDSYVPASVHKSIRWSKTDPLVLTSGKDDISWHILTKSDKKSSVAAVKSSFVLAQGSSPAITKRKISSSSVAPRRKKQKTSHDNSDFTSGSLIIPKGTCWSNNSCAYDPTVTILYNIWLDDTIARSANFKSIGLRFMGLLADSFQRHTEEEYSLEEVRDYLRRSLQRFDPTRFAWGTYASVHGVVDNMLMTDFPVMSSKHFCPNDHPLVRQNVSSVNDCLLSVSGDSMESLQKHIDISESPAGAHCPVCHVRLVRRLKIVYSAPILAFDVAHNVSALDHMLDIPVEGQISRYQLRGVIYHATNHFTARIVTSAGHVWFHDGIATGSSMEDDGLVSSIEDLTTCRGVNVKACVALYVLIEAV